MNSKEKVIYHKKLLDNMHDLYKTKNVDYGDSVSQTFLKYGMVSFLVRIEDKLNRVNTLTNKKEQKVLDEKIEDSLLDMANYCLLALIELKNNKKGN